MIWLVLLSIFIILNAYYSVLFAAHRPQHWQFLVFTAVSAFFMLFSISIFLGFRKLKPAPAPLPRTLPAVDIVKVCYNEDAAMVERSLLSFRKLDYPKELLRIVLLDDSTNKDIASRLERFCSKNGFAYFHRETREGFKAGSLNNYLNGAAEFFAIFDADEELSDPAFLTDNLGFFSDPEVAVVQTNKAVRASGLFERSAAAINGIFYNFVNPACAKSGTGAFLGSAAILKKSAVADAGGFPYSLVEDVAASFILYLHGWKTVHQPKAYSVGKGAADFSSFLEQHNRYIIGMTAMLPTYLKSIPRIRPAHQPFFAFQYLGLYFVSLFQLAYLLYLLYVHLAGAFTQEIAIAALAYFAQSILAVCIISSMTAGSVLTGIVMYSLNFSISIARLFALLLSPLKKQEFVPTSQSSGGSVLLALIPNMLFAALFAYFSYPVSWFTPVALFTALLAFSQLAFLPAQKS